MKKSNWWLVMICCVAAVVGAVYGQGQSLPTFSAADFFRPALENEREKGYYVFQDEQGKTIHMTALPVYVGDEYIAGDNKHYKVVRIKGDVVSLQRIGQVKLSYNPAWDDEASYAAATGDKQKAKIGVYHSHSDESYVPTDGKSSIYGNGGIFKVGDQYAEALKEEGLEVIHSKRSHDPHDANAYSRSRRTAAEMLKQNPIALVDVHRDAVPPEVYKGKVEGKPVTKIKLVVGRRNPKMQENLRFAKDLKAYLDKNKPGLVEGIFMAKGNYNQDLAPNMTLIEAGSHTNKRELAQEGVKLFADAVPKVLGAPTNAPADNNAVPRSQANTGGVDQGATNAAAARDSNRASLSNLFWMLLVVMGGALLFLLISTGSVKGSMDKLKHFTTKEFANALYKRKKK